MIVSYKKLWKLLIDRDLMKKDLREQAGLTTNVIAKMGKNENGDYGPLEAELKRIGLEQDK